MTTKKAEALEAIASMVDNFSKEDDHWRVNYKTIKAFIESIPEPATLAEVENEFLENFTDEDSPYIDNSIALTKEIIDFLKHSCTSYALSQVAEKDKEIKTLEKLLEVRVGEIDKTKDDVMVLKEIKGVSEKRKAELKKKYKGVEKAYIND